MKLIDRPIIFQRSITDQCQYSRKYSYTQGTMDATNSFLSYGQVRISNHILLKHYQIFIDKMLFLRFPRIPSKSIYQLRYEFDRYTLKHNDRIPRRRFECIFSYYFKPINTANLILYL